VTDPETTTETRNSRKVREGRFIREAIEAAVVRKAAVAITDAQLAELAASDEAHPIERSVTSPKRGLSAVERKAIRPRSACRLRGIMLGALGTLVIWNASSPHYRRALGASKGERLWRMQV